MLRDVREGKASSDERSSNTRSKALSTGTEVNKLTTSKDTKAQRELLSETSIKKLEFLR